MHNRALMRWKIVINARFFCYCISMVGIRIYCIYNSLHKIIKNKKVAQVRGDASKMHKKYSAIKRASTCKIQVQ